MKSEWNLNSRSATFAAHAALAVMGVADREQEAAYVRFEPR